MYYVHTYQTVNIQKGKPSISNTDPESTNTVSVTSICASYEGKAMYTDTQVIVVIK